MFRSLGCNTTDINDINLDDDGAGNVGWGDNMQIVGPLGNPSAIYCYWDSSMDPNGTATKPYWGDDGCNPVNVAFDGGDGVAIDNPNENEFAIVGAGEVPEGEVSFAAQENLTWSGNPFPSAININAIQLDDDGAGNVGWGDNMQIVGPLGNPSAIYCYWDSSMDPNGTATKPYWGDDGCNPVDVTLEPGSGFAIDNPNGNTFTIKIACPY